jgi:branched-chain amino acid transport system permease protein
MAISRETGIGIGLLLILFAIPLVAMQAGAPFYVTLATRMAILALAAVGLNIALGLGGLVSFGHAAFFGFGGYAAGILASHAFAAAPLDFGLFTLPGSNSMLVIWPVAILAGGLLAAAIGSISLRTTGVYFIMITLAFAQMTYYFAVSWPAYGGEDGLSIYVRNQFPGINTMAPTSFFYVCFGLLVVVLAGFAALRDSRFGAAFQASRQNEVRVASVGIAPYRIRLAAFVLSGMVTALAGALYADLNRFVSPSMLSWSMSGEFIILIVLGGVGRLAGPLAGAMIFVLFEYLLGGLTERWQFFLGLVLLGVVLFARGGVIGLLAGKARHG